MWEVVLRSTGEVLKNNLPSLAAADAWHEVWLDAQTFDPDNLAAYPAVTIRLM